jgi:hypothetical protein
MSSAIHELQKAILDPSQSVTQLLRRAKIVAAELNLHEVEKWVDLELKGYPPGVPIPAYREFMSEKLLVHNPYRGGWEFAGDVPERLPAPQPIAELEKLVRETTVSFPPDKPYEIADSLGNTSRSRWPQRVTVNPGQFKDILEAVRNELLELTTNLAKQGIKGESMNFNDQEKQKAEMMVFNIGTVQGNVGNVSRSQATFNDYGSLHQTLINKGVPKDERRKLEDLIDELKIASPVQKPGLIQRGMDWIGKNKGFLGASAEIVSKMFE